jgi:hypothetical protein
VTRPFGPRGPSRTIALAWRKTTPNTETLHALADAMRAILGKLATNTKT